MQKYRVIGEKFSDPELGEIVKEGKNVTFNLKITADGFTNMQEVKEFMRKNKTKMETIVKKYCELSMRAKHTEGMFERKENKAVEVILKKLGYL